MQRARYGEEAKSFHALSRHNTLPSETSQVNTSPASVHHLEALWPMSFWVLLEASLHSHDLLKHWPLAIGTTYRGGEEHRRTESSNPLITGLAPLTTSPHPKVLSEIHLINTREKPLSLSLPSSCEQCSEGKDQKYVWKRLCGHQTDQIHNSYKSQYHSSQIFMS